MKIIKSLDLFAGVGGMRISLDKAAQKLNLNSHCEMYSEINNYCQETYNLNFPNTPVVGDIKSINTNDIKSIIPDHDILLAGFPCQPFSKAGISKRKSLSRKHGFDDKDQGDLFFNILDILRIKKPKAFILENVQNLLNYNNGFALKKMLKELRKFYYVPKPEILNAKDFGLAQLRKRIFIIGFLDAKDEFVYPTPHSKETKVKDFLDKKPDKKYIISDLLWKSHKRRKQKNIRKGKGFGFKLTLPSDRYTRTISSRYYKDGSECLIFRGKTRNPRKLTPREVFRLQGFPESFKFKVSDLQAYRQAGNAVPIKVVEKVCLSVLKYILKNNKNTKKVA